MKTKTKENIFEAMKNIWIDLAEFKEKIIYNYWKKTENLDSVPTDSLEEGNEKNQASKLEVEDKCAGFISDS